MYVICELQGFVIEVLWVEAPGGKNSNYLSVVSVSVRFKKQKQKLS